MRMRRVALLVNLALAAGLAVGYGAWGRRTASLENEVKAARAQIEQLAREREACHAGGRGGEQLWEGRGVVRAVYPRMLIVTHEDIPGLLPARTTGFRLADTVDRDRAMRAIPSASGCKARARTTPRWLGSRRGDGAGRRGQSSVDPVGHPRAKRRHAPAEHRGTGERATVLEFSGLHDRRYARALLPDMGDGQCSLAVT